MATNDEKSFGPFRVDDVNACLWRGQEAIQLRPKAFALLTRLMESPGDLVTKDDLLEAVWPGTFVGDAVLKDSIRQLREALGDDAQAPRYIETVHRRGYRFVGAPKPSAKPSAASSSATPPAETVAPHDAQPSPQQEAKPLAQPVPAIEMVGRDDALAQLRVWLDRALRGERQVVFVTGEPGMGKTTLVEALLESSIPAGALVARGQCFEVYGAGEPYLPVLDGLARLGRGGDSEPVVAALREHAPTWLAQLPKLVTPGDREALQRQVAGATRERMLREVAEALEALAADRLVALVIEDLHWSDYSTLDLISYLARRRDPARLLVIGTYRPVEVVLGDHPLKGVKRELQAHRLCSELPLEYLSEETAAEYLDARFPGNAFPALLARLIHQRTAGNPLFMVNVVEFLLDERAIAEEAGVWRLTGGLAAVEAAVPESVRNLIERQIERLSPDEQRALEGASVVGPDCSTTAIAAGLAEDPAWVDAHCEELARRHQFLEPPRIVELPDGTVTPRYRFTHALYVDVPYGRIPAMRRMEIHRRIAASGEAIYGDRVGEIAAELAMHFEQGRDWPKAAAYLQQAAGTAMDRSAYHEAEGLARRGLAILARLPDSPDRDAREISLRMTLGAALMASRGFAVAELEEVFGRAMDLSLARGPSVQSYSVLWSIGLFRVFRSDMRAAHATARNLVALATTLDDRALLTEAHRGLGVTLVEMGEFAEGVEHLDRAADLFRREERNPYAFLTAYDTAVVSRAYSARAMWALGETSAALARVDEALRTAREIDHDQSAVVAATFAAMVRQFEGDVAAVREHAETVLTLAREHGLAMWEAFGEAFRGWAVAREGDAATGLAELRRGLDTYAATGASLWRVYFLGLLADALAASGERVEALAIVDSALAAVEATGERHSESDLLRLRGELLPDRREARASLTRAVEVARAQGARSFERRAAESLGRARAV